MLLFAAFAVVVNFGLLREPYESRVADVIVLPAILFGVLLAVLLRADYPAVARWPLRVVALVLMLLAVKSLAVAGDFGDRTAMADRRGSIARAGERGME